MMQKTVVFLLGMLITSVLGAREVSILVQDADLGIALEGATISNFDGTKSLTNEQGLANVTVPEDRQVVIVVSYPGYSNSRLVCGLADTRLTAKMRMSMVMEGQELVIEARKQGKTDAVVGQSQVIPREVLQQTAKIGLVEDVMSAIKTLPGVGFTGGWNAMPSIRGGAPEDLTAALDGFYIDNPYHWGGAFSIFNPNATESAKLSHGVFSSRYGGATSGLLEVSSLKLDNDQVRMNADFTTSALELSMLLPFGGKGGLLLGGKVTYWDPFVALAGLIDPSIAGTISTAPFIRTAYLKSSYNFDSQVEWFINSYIGSDGVGIKTVLENETKTSSNTINFDWINTIGFAYTGFRFLPDPKFLIKLTAGIGGTGSKAEGDFLLDGSFTYSTRFISDWDLIDGLTDGLINGASGYTVDNRPGAFVSQRDNYYYQIRLDMDADLGSSVSLAFGANENITQPNFINNGTTYQTIPNQFDVNTGKIYSSLVELDFDLAPEGNTVFASGGYGLLQLGTASDPFRMELGLRVDHIYILGGSGSNFELDTKPVANPRLSLNFDLFNDTSSGDRLVLSLGSGLFSRPTSNVFLIDETYNLVSGQLGPDRTWTNVLGLELELGSGYKVQLEAYYKYGFDRFYYDQVTSGNTINIVPHFNGESHIWGIDLLLQKLESRYFDGWITYSFNYARYRDPDHDPASVSQYGSDSGAWYWPSFHRFHTANLIFNWKPVEGFNIMTKLSFGSGTPQQATGEIESMAAERDDGVIEEFYARDQSYSDTLRTEFSIPLDIKLTWFWYDKDSKVRNEFYVAAENVLTNLYEPKGATTFDSTTGQEYPGNASFSIGIPMFSIGFNWSF